MTISWLRQIESLQPGDACEFRWPNRKAWRAGIVRRNGGGGYWEVEVAESYVDEVNGAHEAAGLRANAVYIENVRLPGQTEAWNG